MIPPRREDAGLTLIELLVAMAVMLIIMTPLVSSFVLTLATTTTADQDATNSGDEQTLTSYLPIDIADADTVAVSSTCGGADSVLALTWLDGATQHVVAYQVTTDPAVQATLGVATPVYRLTRYDCTPGASSSVVVVRSGASRPTALCDSTACSGSTTKPRSVAITVSDLARRVTEAPLVFTVSGTRRVTT